MISSEIKKFNELGEETGIDNVKAQGIVMGTCVYNYSDSIDLKKKTVKISKPLKKGCTIGILSKSFSTSCCYINNKYYIMTDKKQFKLFGKLQLPLYVERRYKIPYECIDYDYSDKEAEKILALRLDNFLKDKCEKGVQIIGKNVKMDSDGVTCRLKATITVFQDMIH